MPEELFRGGITWIGPKGSVGFAHLGELQGGESGYSI